MQFLGKAQKWKDVPDGRKMSSDLDFANEMEIHGKPFQEEKYIHTKHQGGKHKIIKKNKAYVNTEEIIKKT